MGYGCNEKQQHGPLCREMTAKDSGNNRAASKQRISDGGRLARPCCRITCGPQSAALRRATAAWPTCGRPHRSRTEKHDARARQNPYKATRTKAYRQPEAHSKRNTGNARQGNPGPKKTCPTLLKSAGHVKTHRIQKAARTAYALSKARYLAAQLPADLANDGVDEGRLRHVELASRHERDRQSNQPTRHDIR